MDISDNGSLIVGSPGYSSENGEVGKAKIYDFQDSYVAYKLDHQIMVLHHS